MPWLVEPLEDRTLLSVTTLLIDNGLSVVSDADDDLAVSVDVLGNVVVDVNGQLQTMSPPVAAAMVESITVVGGDLANSIDLSGVNAAGFSFQDIDGNPVAIHVDGGNGDDTLVGSFDLVATILGGDGDDTISLVGLTADHFADGGNGDDIISGGDGAETLVGGDGNDTLTGGLGNDVISGDDGADVVTAGDGQDSINGGGGPDLLDGGDGNDDINGESGRDTIIGGDGDDTLRGGSSHDELYGDTTDPLVLSTGNDLVQGQGENDTIIGGGGVDVLQGGPGADLIRSTFFVEVPPPPPAPPQLPAPPPPTSGLQPVAVDDTAAMRANTTLVIDVVSNDIDSGGGLDFSSVRMTSLAASGLVTNLQDGRIAYRPDLSFGGTDSFTYEISDHFGLSSNEATITIDVIAPDGGDLINGGGGNDSLFGNDGEDRIFGGGGNDSLDGYLNDDVLRGQSGRDTLCGGGGADRLDGGTGDDLLDSCEPLPDETLVAFLPLLDITDAAVLEGNPPAELFFPATNYLVSDRPHSISAGDVTGDGFPELITVGKSDDVVNILQNNGDGTFSPFRQLDVGDDPDDAQLGDLDGDGDLDLVVSNEFDDTFSVLIQTAVGQFAPQVTYPLGDHPCHLALADLDGDGDLDAAFTDAFGKGLSLYFNDGSGTFEGRTDYDVGGRPHEVQAGDLDGDGDLDLAVARNNSGAISILLNQGSGTFADPVTYDDRAPAHGLTLADFDLDGDLDVVAVHVNKDLAFSYFPNNGDATFGTRFDYTTIKGDMRGVDSADINRDGIPDLAVTEFAEPVREVHVFLGIGDGTFSGPFSFATGYDSSEPVFMDLDLDGRFVDLAVANETSDDVSVLLNRALVTEMNFTVSLSEPSYAEVTVDWTTEIGTALQTDFVSDAGEIVLQPGQVSRQITVDVVPDSTPEANESFGVVLSNPVNAVIRDGDGSGMIQNDDQGMSFASFQSGESDGSSAFFQQFLENGFGSTDFGDTLLGREGNDTLLGGGASDLLSGGSGRDLLRGGDANDRLYGGGGVDDLDGEGGQDTLDGQGAADVLNGGSGDDTLIWYHGAGSDLIDGGGDFNTLEVRDRAAGNSFVVQENQGDLEFSTDARMQVSDGTHLVNVEFTISDVLFRTGGGNDTITLSDVSHVPSLLLDFNGQAGNDMIDASGVDPGVIQLIFDGGKGNDTVLGSVVADVILGSDGDDALFGGGGRDSLYGGDGDDLLEGQDADDLLHGELGFDTLDGGPGNDLLYGAEDNDLLLGRSGDDTLSGDAGRDTVNGNSGDDRVLGGDGHDKLFGGSGNDFLDGGRDNDSLNGNSGNDRLQGNHGDDWLQGSRGDDTVLGGDGRDRLFGDRGDDALVGGDGNDTLNGSRGDDLLLGGDGDDVLLAGSGKDVVLGEMGNDFVKGQGGTRDTIAGGEGTDRVFGLESEIHEAFQLSATLIAALDEI